MEETWQWAFAFLGAFLVGLSKTGIAGLGVLTVAIFATVLPARESVGVLLVILVVADIVAVTVYRRDANWKHLVRLFPWAAVGVIAGAVAFGSIDDTGIGRLIGSILVLLVVFQIIRRRTSAGGSLVENPPGAIVILTGLSAGFTTMVANAAGPLMIIYLLAMRLPKINFIGTSAWFFLFINLFKVPFGHHLGIISPESVGLSLQLAPLAVAGALSGRWLIRFINQGLFESIALWLTLVAGVRLLFT